MSSQGTTLFFDPVVSNCRDSVSFYTNKFLFLPIKVHDVTIKM